MTTRTDAWKISRAFEDAVEDWCATAGMAEAREVEAKREALLALICQPAAVTTERLKALERVAEVARAHVEGERWVESMGGAANVDELAGALAALAADPDGQGGET